ncbi:MAG: type II toxin-antitoxin system VapC family toxin [Acidobacteria bacterium]|nr:type II toxin-antitoxin system VapC family toxin [Pyrinomonadaceae bacterium]MBA3786074.1 type II toxin-antitoxin system VapC family toxin [Acidobacteriota bacterium]
MIYFLKYLLDTNACIVYIRNSHSGVRSNLESLPKSEIAVCAIVKAEMFYGSMKSENPQKSLLIQQKFFSQFLSLPFDDKSALIFGEIRADLARKGTPIGGYDMQIAAIALANDLILVTHNTKEFSRISNIKLTDWEV